MLSENFETPWLVSWRTTGVQVGYYSLTRFSFLLSYLIITVKYILYLWLAQISGPIGDLEFFKEDGANPLNLQHGQHHILKGLLRVCPYGCNMPVMWQIRTFVTESSNHLALTLHAAALSLCLYYAHGEPVLRIHYSMSNLSVSTLPFTELKQVGSWSMHIEPISRIKSCSINNVAPYVWPARMWLSSDSDAWHRGVPWFFVLTTNVFPWYSLSLLFLSTIVPIDICKGCGVDDSHRT